MICHNGGDRIRQREQGYRISSVGRRYEDSLFSCVGGGRSRILPRTGISSAIYVVSRSTSLTSPLLSAFGADRDKGVAVSASARSSEVRSYSLPIPHI